MSAKFDISTVWTGFGHRAKAWYTNQVVAALFEELPPDSVTILDIGRTPAQELQLKFALRPDSSVVERGPEKAGVGGSIPSLATTPFSAWSLRSPSCAEPNLGNVLESPGSGFGRRDVE